MTLQRKIIIIMILFISSTLYSQSLNGLGIELGAGHNQLFWETADGLEANRTQFWITGNIKCVYDIELSKNISVIPFIGYNRFGGKSDIGPGPGGTGDVEYQDKIWIDALDGGFHLLYRYQKFRFGPGLKYSRHLKASSKASGVTTDSSGVTRTWESEGNNDIMFFFRKNSYSLSLRADYRLGRHVYFAFESWFGQGHLESPDWEDIITIKQNHYRLLLGLVL